MTNRPMFTVDTLAVFLHLSHSQVYRLIRDKGMTAYRVSGQWYIYKDDVIAFYSRSDISTRAKNKFIAVQKGSAI